MLELTAVEIAKLAFSGIIQAGTGALSVAGAKKLWSKIRDKFQGNPIAEKALNDAEEQQSSEILEQQVIPLLQITMSQDSQFASVIQNMAQEIKQEIKTSTGSQKNISVEDTKASGKGAVAIGNVEVEGQVRDLGVTHQKKS